MKKEFFPPIAVLTAILVFSLFNGSTMKADTDRWRAQLQQADALAQAEDWPGAMEALTDSYQDWSARQTYLHIISEHAIIDEAEGMYHRAMAFAVSKEPSEFRAEVADLRDQLRLLAERERFSLKNIL